MDRAAGFVAPPQVTLGRKVHQVASHGVLGGMALSTLQMLAAMMGWLPPRASAMMQEVVDLSALVHSLQLLYRKVI